MEKFIENQMKLYKNVREQMDNYIFGQKEMKDALMTAVFANPQGRLTHILLEGPPGVGKSMMCDVFSKLCDLKYNRIQMLPDMQPQDLIGGLTVKKGNATTPFLPDTEFGAIFGNILLVDEINRTTPKVQSALLSAMGEMKVSMENKNYELGYDFKELDSNEDFENYYKNLPEENNRVFVVLATQNPYDRTGTYSLPEAELDRFMLKIRIEYPSALIQKHLQLVNTLRSKLESLKYKEGDDIKYIKPSPEYFKDFMKTLAEYYKVLYQEKLVKLSKENKNNGAVKSINILKYTYMLENADNIIMYIFKFENNELKEMLKEVLKALEDDELKEMSEVVLKALSDDELKEMSEVVLKALSDDELKGKLKEMLKEMLKEKLKDEIGKLFSKIVEIYILFHIYITETTYKLLLNSMYTGYCKISDTESIKSILDYNAVVNIRKASVLAVKTDEKLIKDGDNKTLYDLVVDFIEKVNARTENFKNKISPRVPQYIIQVAQFKRFSEEAMNGKTTSSFITKSDVEKCVMEMIPHRLILTNRAEVELEGKNRDEKVFNEVMGIWDAVAADYTITDTEG